MYRPPNTNITELFEAIEETLSQVVISCNPILYAGAINIDLLDINSSNTTKKMNY